LLSKLPWSWNDLIKAKKSLLREISKVIGKFSIDADFSFLKGRKNIFKNVQELTKINLYELRIDNKKSTN